MVENEETEDVQISEDDDQKVQKGLNKLKKIEEWPRNVTTTKKEIRISEFNLDCLYNSKMEKVRDFMHKTLGYILPIEIVLMKSETADCTE